MGGNTDKLLKRHVFCFNDEDNGGESLILTTEMYANGDPDGVYYNQELTLQSYGNSASFNLYSAMFNPENLRRLADELRQAHIEAECLTPGHVKLGVEYVKRELL